MPVKGKHAKTKKHRESTEDEDDSKDDSEDEDDEEELEVPPGAKEENEEDFEEYVKSLAPGTHRKKDYVTIGFIGSPNVGKSTLVHSYLSND